MPKLTIRNIQNIKAGACDVFTWDDELRGFGVRVKPSGRGTFVVQYRNQYKATRRMTLGSVDVLKPEEARRLARAILVKVASGEDPSQDRKDKHTAPTVKELADRYLAEHAYVKKKPKSISTDESNLRNHVLPALGHMKVAAVTRDHVAKLHRGMRVSLRSV